MCYYCGKVFEIKYNLIIPYNLILAESSGQLATIRCVTSIAIKTSVTTEEKYLILNATLKKHKETDHIISGESSRQLASHNAM